MRGGTSTFFEERLATSVKFNGLFYPPNSVCHVVFNCVVPMVYGNPDVPEYPLSRTGSGFKVVQSGRYSVFSSEHQHKNFDPEWAVLPSKSEKTWISGNGYTALFNEDGTIPDLDLRKFDFTDSIQNGSLDKSGWYLLHRKYHWQKILGCIAFGYPTEINQIYEHPDKIDLQCIACTGDYLGATVGELHGMQLEKQMDVDPDGMSGGPVFFLVRNRGELEVIPAGIITNANRRIINFVHARKLQRLLNI